MLLIFSLLCILLAACSNDAPAPAKQTARKVTVSTSPDTTPITYDASPQSVVIRTFYGGGNLGTLELSPEMSIYGDGSFILGPGLQMRRGQLSSEALDKLLMLVADTDGLLRLGRQQFYEVADQNATFLELALNGKQYAFLYGPFGTVQESSQDMDAYQSLGKALTSIREALQGPTRPYSSSSIVLLVHQTLSPDLSQTVPYWSYSGFSLHQVATYECGATLPDETGPNADSGCLTFTVPQKALLLAPAELQAMSTLLSGQGQGTFLEQGLYYRVMLRPLLPDEVASKMLAMLGSQELSYSGVPVRGGPLPVS